MFAFQEVYSSDLHEQDCWDSIMSQKIRVLCPVTHTHLLTNIPLPTPTHANTHICTSPSHPPTSSSTLTLSLSTTPSHPPTSTTHTQTLTNTHVSTYTHTHPIPPTHILAMTNIHTHCTDFTKIIYSVFIVAHDTIPDMKL